MAHQNQGSYDSAPVVNPEKFCVMDMFLEWPPAVSKFPNLAVISLWAVYFYGQWIGLLNIFGLGFIWLINVKFGVRGDQDASQVFWNFGGATPWDSEIIAQMSRFGGTYGGISY